MYRWEGGDHLFKLLKKTFSKIVKSLWWHYYKSTDQEDEDGEGDENSLMEVTLDLGDHKEEADENDEMVVISGKTHQVSLDFN